jgi:hypothetical protein
MPAFSFQGAAEFNLIWMTNQKNVANHPSLLRPKITLIISGANRRVKSGLAIEFALQSPHYGRVPLRANHRSAPLCLGATVHEEGEELLLAAS